MIIQRFTQFILKRRFNAILIAILFALVPYLNWVSGIVVGLITLRKGVTEGFMITLWAALPGLVILFHTGLWVPFVANVAYGTFLVWILAILLRRTANWSLVLCLTALLGVVGVLVMHLAVKNVSAWWFQYFNFSLTQLEQVVSIPASAESNMTIMLQKLSVVATGLQIMFFSLAAIIVLFMARGLEDRFFKPGCLAQEAYQIRMPILASLVFIGWLFLGRQEAGFFLDALPVLVLPFILAGISLIHAILVAKKLARGWFTGFYIVLIFIAFFMPALLLIVVMMALFDSLINFRKRFLFNANKIR